jgi:hypothetical protein
MFHQDEGISPTHSEQYKVMWGNNGFGERTAEKHATHMNTHAKEKSNQKGKISFYFDLGLD